MEGIFPLLSKLPCLVNEEGFIVEKDSSPPHNDLGNTFTPNVKHEHMHEPRTATKSRKKRSKFGRKKIVCSPDYSYQKAKHNGGSYIHSPVPMVSKLQSPAIPSPNVENSFTTPAST